MKLRPGCGCLVLVLSIFNLLLVCLMIWGLVRGTASRSPQAFSMLLVFVSDFMICLLVGLAAIRGGGREPATANVENVEQDEGEEPET